MRNHDGIEYRPPGVLDVELDARAERAPTHAGLRNRREPNIRARAARERSCRHVSFDVYAARGPVRHAEAPVTRARDGGDVPSNAVTVTREADALAVELRFPYMVVVEPGR